LAAHLTALTSGKNANKTEESLQEIRDAERCRTEASATGLAPKRPHVLGLSSQADGGGTLESLASFMTNPAGSAIVNAI
jgi:hypothetical protein